MERVFHVVARWDVLDVYEQEYRRICPHTEVSVDAVVVGTYSAHSAVTRAKVSLVDEVVRDCFDCGDDLRDCYDGRVHLEDDVTVDRDGHDLEAWLLLKRGYFRCFGLV